MFGSIPVITYDFIGFESHTIFILPASYMDIKHSSPNIPSFQYRLLSTDSCYDDIGTCHDLRIIASAGDKMNIWNYFIKFGYELIFGRTAPGSNFTGSDRWEEMFQQSKVHPSLFSGSNKSNCFYLLRSQIFSCNTSHSRCPKSCTKCSVDYSDWESGFDFRQQHNSCHILDAFRSIGRKNGNPLQSGYFISQ